MNGHARSRPVLFVTARIFAALLTTPGTAHAESYRTWAITQAEACALPLIRDIPPISAEGLIDPAYVMYTAARTSCANITKPVTDASDLAFGAAEVAQATAVSASPNDIMDILAGSVTLQAASLTDVQYAVSVDVTNPEVYVGAQSDWLGIGSGYAVGADTANDGSALVTSILESNVASGCLSGDCGILLAGLYQQPDGGPGNDGSGGNNLNRMNAFWHRTIAWDPKDNNNRADGYGNYYYFDTRGYKYRSDVDFYATSMWASVQKSGDNRLKKVYMSAIPGKSMEVVEAAPRGVAKNGSSIGSTTISATFSGEVKAGNDQGGASGGAGIGLSRSYERYEGSGGGGVLHDGTHYTTWIAGNKAGTTTNRTVDGVTTWAVPSGTSAHWDWQAIATTCDNPCWND